MFRENDDDVICSSRCWFSQAGAGGCRGVCAACVRPGDGQDVVRGRGAGAATELAHVLGHGGQLTTATATGARRLRPEQKEERRRCQIGGGVLTQGWRVRIGNDGRRDDDELTVAEGRRCRCSGRRRRCRRGGSPWVYTSGSGRRRAPARVPPLLPHGGDVSG